ncbi:PA0069 family radical SAM protein [Oleiagrimonas sp. C23AA]|uniref:PA0069 family radical SAM protein n=1 Tax=Oleiagrimonas sp. C23AA TaxID=2719047 RepID=UPI001421CEE6|nr:PA0069 family radical SAM protein [Oleiagrimonas sp. C23AA]
MGCIYCYARPSHAYLNLSPGLDFETKLFAKTNAAQVLRAQLARPGYRCSAINIGSNTDPYQPLEKRLTLTRQLLEVMVQTRHPCTLVTKNALVERDIDLLADLARDGLVLVLVSCASLDNRLAAALEPRASAPHRRLKAIERLSAAGIPTGVLTAPMIPALNDTDMERIIERAAAAGARSAGYTVLRLPHELKALFAEWLQLHAPQRKAHVLSVLSQMHGGRTYDARFGQRMRGAGPFAQLLRQRFAVACRRHGMSRARETRLRCDLFQPPRPPSPQGELF